MLPDILWLDNKGKEVIANIYLTASEFTDYGVATVHAYNPLAKNQRVKLYINEEDALIDRRIVEGFLQSFQQEFTKVYDFQQGLALAVKKKARKESQEDVQIVSGQAKGERERKASAELERTSLYIVKITFTGMLKKEVIQFIQARTEMKLQIIAVKDYYAEILIPTEEDADIRELERFLYYYLDKGKLGQYEYYQLL